MNDPSLNSESQSDPLWVVLGKSDSRPISLEFTQSVLAEARQTAQDRQIVPFRLERVLKIALPAAALVTVGAFFALTSTPIGSDLTAQEALDVELLQFVAEKPETLSDDQVLDLIF